MAPESHNRPPEGLPPPESEPRYIDADIERYVLEHAHEKEWSGAAMDLDWAKKHRNGEYLLHHFERESRKTFELGSPDLKDLRRMVHRLDALSHIQRDLPESTITDRLRIAARSIRVGASIHGQGREYADAVGKAFDEDVDRYVDPGDCEGVLHRVEIMIDDLNDVIESGERRRVGTHRENLKRNAKVEAAKKRRDDWRIVRASLLEQYFSPKSMH